MAGIKLKYKRWWYYLIPGARRWLKECDKILNSESQQIEKECQTAMQDRGA